MEIVFITTLMEAAIVVILLGILFVAGQLLRGKGKYAIRRWMRKEQAINIVEAKAIVLAIEQTGLYMNHKPQVVMQMQVIPDRGKNFMAEVKEILSFIDLAIITTGSMVTVKYDQGNIKQVMLVKAA